MEVFAVFPTAMELTKPVGVAEFKGPT